MVDRLLGNIAELVLHVVQDLDQAALDVTRIPLLLVLDILVQFLPPLGCVKYLALVPHYSCCASCGRMPTGSRAW